MAASPQSKWMTFLEDNLLDDAPQPNAFFWCGLNEQADISVDNSCCAANVDDHEKVGSKKRARDDHGGGTSSKACREKMRRDRLNDRFLELGTLLEPGRTPKTDKIVILSDALRTLNQLKAEAQQLNESNEKLRESIKKLKIEKGELRDEKQRLKAEKERLEQQMKLMSMPAGYLPHPAAVHAAMSAFAAQNQVAGGKAASVPGFPGMGLGMWQWMPPAALDTSQDHMLRPPVA
ncbi:hypothetical protein GOP47_0029212 [Adiantum capillus-veneris]|nr:hypothetical protein GOP47_0029212 [Adiantum capillus-veneris]